MEECSGFGLHGCKMTSDAEANRQRIQEASTLVDNLNAELARLNDEYDHLNRLIDQGGPGM